MTAGSARSLVAAVIANEQAQRIIATSRKATTQPTAGLAGLRLAVVGSATGANHSAINPQSCSWHRTIAPNAGACNGFALLARVRAKVGNMRSNRGPTPAAPHSKLSLVAGAAVLIRTVDALDLGDQPPAPIAEASSPMVSAHESAQPGASGGARSAFSSSSAGAGEASPGLGLRRRGHHVLGALPGGVQTARVEPNLGSSPR